MVVNRVNVSYIAGSVIGTVFFCYDDKVSCTTQNSVDEKYHCLLSKGYRAFGCSLSVLVFQYILTPLCVGVDLFAM